LIQTVRMVMTMITIQHTHTHGTLSDWKYECAVLAKQVAEQQLE
jgi:hypothetical protein